MERVRGLRARVSSSPSRTCLARRRRAHATHLRMRTARAVTRMPRIDPRCETGGGWQEPQREQGLRSSQRPIQSYRNGSPSSQQRSRVCRHRTDRGARDDVAVRARRYVRALRGDCIDETRCRPLPVTALRLGEDRSALLERPREYGETRTTPAFPSCAPRRARTRARGPRRRRAWSLFSSSRTTSGSPSSRRSPAESGRLRSVSLAECVAAAVRAPVEAIAPPGTIPTSRSPRRRRSSGSSLTGDSR